LTRAHRRAAVTLAAAALLLVALVLASIRQANRQAESARLVAHTHEVIERSSGS
jgi:hypothetical protein